LSTILKVSLAISEGENFLISKEEKQDFVTPLGWADSSERGFCEGLQILCPPVEVVCVCAL